MVPNTLPTAFAESLHSVYNKYPGKEFGRVEFVYGWDAINISISNRTTTGCNCLIRQFGIPLRAHLYNIEGEVIPTPFPDRPIPHSLRTITINQIGEMDVIKKLYNMHVDNWSFKEALKGNDIINLEIKYYKKLMYDSFSNVTWNTIVESAPKSQKSSEDFVSVKRIENTPRFFEFDYGGTRVPYAV